MVEKILNKICFFIKFFFKPKTYFKACKSQNNNEENLFLKSLSTTIKRNYFVEIGFHYKEFNTVGLIENNFNGQLIDGGRFLNIFIMKLLIFFLKKKVEIKNKFVTEKNIISLFDTKSIGCLSIDIDGNDYWILKKIMEENILPEIIIVEYNPSFLDKSISVPYEDKFDRIKKHRSGFYHGASLSAFSNLLSKYKYNLVKCIGGVNAIFVDNQIKDKNNLKSFTSEEVYQEGKLRNLWSNSNARFQFDQIKHLRLDEV